jgi:hypothetical protein
MADRDVLRIDLGGICDLSALACAIDVHVASHPVLLFRDIEDGPDKSTSSPASRRYLLDFYAWAARGMFCSSWRKYEERGK